MSRIKSSPDHQAPAVLQPDFDPRVARYVGRGFRHLHFHESRRRVFPQPFLPPVEMRRAQLPLSAERRHTLPAPHLFGNQPAPLRPCFSVSFSLRHRATLLCDDPLPQDAVHVALTLLSHRRGSERDKHCEISAKWSWGYTLQLRSRFLEWLKRKILVAQKKEEVARLTKSDSIS